MNEQIKKLIKEAGISTADYYRNLDDPKVSYSKGIVDEWSEDFKQQLNLEPYLRIRKMDEAQLTKFAELIIEECAILARKMEIHNVPFIGVKILEHFGVEE
jgi:hypothetical protein